MHRKSGKIEAGQTLRSERFLHTAGNGSAVPIRPAAEGDHTFSFINPHFRSEFTRCVHQGRQGAQRSRFTAQDAAAERADLQAGPLRLLHLAALQTALRSRQQGRRAERRGLDGGAECALLLVLIKADGKKLRLRSPLQRRLIRRQRQHLRDAAAPGLLCGRGGDLLPALELFGKRALIRPGDAARALGNATSSAAPSSVAFWITCSNLSALAKAIYTLQNTAASLFAAVCSCTTRLTCPGHVETTQCHSLALAVAHRDGISIVFQRSTRACAAFSPVRTRKFSPSFARAEQKTRHSALPSRPCGGVLNYCLLL